MRGEHAESLNRFVDDSHRAETRRCKRCGVRKALWAFYRERTCRGGRRPECKRCHARWRRQKYEPGSGRRNLTRADRAEREAAEWRAQKG